MKKKVLYISFTILVIIIITFIVLPKKSVFGKPHFVQYNASFSAPSGSSYTIDLAYFVVKGSKNILDPQLIKQIKFKNSNTTNIESINYKKSDSSKKYDIRNLALKVNFINSGKENLNNIVVTFNDNTVREYSIGHWYFDVSNHNEESNYIEMGEEFPLVTNDFNGYNFNFKNNSSKKIEIIDLGINLFEAKLKNYNLSIDPYSRLNTLLEASSLNKDNKFYIIRPKITYQYDNKSYAYFPYATYYGFLSMNDKDIDNEVSKTN
ncbi:hypothetical protein [Paenibacillus vini]|uniref:DUF3298 domain-containing protein n=1 Tax=Paenibacillus vini TaxID=1476024 RepID=A0ABQ4MB22_9BACL|nr:hypothetical protein [Paenibacillus vini]GIP53123.1 hypothetical protein J42TS3_21580 [Paenibacillus vini]